jgi:hypothetical protein
MDDRAPGSARKRLESAGDERELAVPAPANSNARVSYHDSLILTPDVSFFDDDLLIAKGKEFAAGLLGTEPEEVRRHCSNAAESYATTLVNRRINDGDSVTDAEVRSLSDTLQTEKSQVPPFRAALRDAEEQVYRLERERGLLGEPVPRPKQLPFVIAGVCLGLLFGMLASLTAAEALWSIFPEEASVPAGKDSLFHLAVGIALASGVLTGTLTHVFRHLGLTSTWMIRHGGALMGSLLAVSLAVFRLLQDVDPDLGGGVRLNVTAIGVVLFGLEIALVVGIEMLDSALNAAWLAHHDGSARIRSLEVQISYAKKEVEQRRAALEREEADVAQAKQALDHANKMRHVAAVLKAEKNDQIAHCKNLVQQGFDIEWRRLMNQGA